VALRLERGGFLAAAALAAVLALATAASFPGVMGATPAEQQAAARLLQRLAPYTSVLLPAPVGVETLAGFVQWRVFGGLPVLFVAWALLAGTAAIRGDEARGRLEQWLAAGVSRRRWVAARAGGFALAAAGAAAVAGVGAAAGAALAGGRLPLLALAGECVALWGLAAACFGVALVAAEAAASRRGAVALGGGLLAGHFLLNSLPRGAGATPPSRWLSPFSWYERSAALAPGGRFDAPVTLALVAAAALLAAGCGAALARRDLGAPLLRGRPRRRGRGPVLVPSRSAVWRAPVAAALYEQRLALLGWAAAAAALTGALTGMAGPIAEVLLTSPATRGGARLLGTGDPERALLGYFLFGTLQLVLALYAVADAGRWAAEDTSGRLELRLSAPVPRWRVVLERALALSAALTVIAAVGTAAGVLGAGARGSPLDGRAAWAAGAALLPFGLSVGGVGAALVGARPRAAVPLLGAITIGSFFLLELGLVFGWPAWLVRLSVFGLYGTPLVEGLAWPGLAALAVVGLAGFAAAALALAGRDVGR
jgi:ABC-2 type transport system permease protein